MATRWENVSIPLQGGIDTKTDKKAASPASFVELENAVFTKRGSLRKRHGYDLIEGSPDAQVLGTIGAELLVLGEQDAKSYDPESGKFSHRGYFHRVFLEKNEVESSSHELTLADQAEAHGITVRAFLSTAGGMEVSISNTATGAIYRRLGGGIVGTGNRPRVVRVGDFVHVVFAVAASTNLYSLPINPWTPANTVDADVVVIASDLHADEIFDVVSNSGQTNALFAWYSTGVNTLRYGRLFQNGTTGEKNDEGTLGVVTCISLAANKHLLFIAYYDQNSLQTRARFVLNVNSTMSPLGPVIGASRLNTKVSVALSDTQYFWLEEPVLPADHENQSVTCIYGDIDAGGTVTNSGFLDPVMRHCGIASKGFSVDGRLYFWLKHESAKQLQNGYFLIQAIPGTGPKVKVIGHLAIGEGTQIDAEFHFPSFAVSEAGTIKGVLPFQRKVPSTDGGTFMHRGILEIAVDTSSSSYDLVQVGDTGYAPGGMVWAIDGKEPTESGFLLFPEPDIDFGATAHSFVDASKAGVMGAGTYGYKVFYEFIADNGEIHRSTAIPFSVVVAASRKVMITIPTLDLTHRGLSNGLGVRSEVSISVFRTAADGTLFHRCSGIDPGSTAGDGDYLLNDRDKDSLVFTDNMSDAELLKNEVDPFTGTLDNLAPPACDLAIEAQRRLFFAGGSIPDNSIHHTKLRADGGPVEYNDALLIELPDRGGAVTAIASLSDNLVVFKREQIYVISGQGPNNLGLGGFSEPVQISTDVGCINARSLVETPGGYLFQSEKGLYLLDRGFSVKYVGTAVEEFNGQALSGAHLVPDENLVIFLSPDGRTLDYDYFYDQWGTFTNHSGTSATTWDGKYCYLRANGDLLIQSPDRYKDGNVAYQLRARTGPLRIEGLQGVWRCKRIYLLGEYFSRHSLRVNLYFDRESAPRETVIFEPADFIDLSTWGDDATWGDSETFGGSLEGRDYQVSYAPAKQKCQSLSLEFIEIPGQQAGRSLELAELALRYATKEGLARLPSYRRK